MGKWSVPFVPLYFGKKKARTETRDRRSRGTHQIDPKRAIPRAEHVKSSKIFVGGLAPSVTNASLKTFFTEFGNVMDAHVMFDRETNRNKGFGFVTFEDEESVERAMGATGMELDGKTVSPLALEVGG
jgi:RNA recognition motif-containing protein